jgi:hypothetical protein
VQRCSVSIMVNDNQTHFIETEAGSLFEAAWAGLHDWAKQWWYQAPHAHRSSFRARLSQRLSVNSLRCQRPARPGGRRINPTRWQWGW